jgi:transcriptional regulator with XRE-family HTH domain
VNNTRNEKYLRAFGQNLRRIRKEKGLTMEALSFEAEIEYRQLGRIERGEVNTTISTVYVLAKALKIEESELFKFKPQGK